jgi:hypothetical protein
MQKEEEVTEEIKLSMFSVDASSSQHKQIYPALRGDKEGERQ